MLCLLLRLVTTRYSEATDPSLKTSPPQPVSRWGTVSRDSDIDRGLSPGSGSWQQKYNQNKRLIVHRKIARRWKITSVHRCAAKVQGSCAIVYLGVSRMTWHRDGDTRQQRLLCMIRPGIEVARSKPVLQK